MHPSRSTQAQRREAREYVADLPAVCGVYRITCTATGECYVGGTVDVQIRIRTHLGLLHRGIHSSSFFQRAFDTHGLRSLTVDVLEECEVDRLDERESHWFDKLRPQLCAKKPHETRRTTRATRKAWRERVAEEIESGERICPTWQEYAAAMTLVDNAPTA